MSRTSEPRGGPLPQVTVVLPAYNGHLFLAEQIKSILNQQDVILTLRIVDDASTDDSWGVIRAAKASDTRVTINRHVSNQGLIATLNELLADVETDYFSLADQDDIWDPDKLARSVDQLRSSDSSLVYSNVRTCDSEGRVLQEDYWDSNRILPQRGNDPVPFIIRNPAIGHTLVGSRALLDLARPMPSSLVYHEAWLAASAMQLEGIDYIADPLGSYRVHMNNVAGPKDRNWIAKIAHLRIGTIRRRQRIRTNAYDAIARIHPELAPISDRMQSSGRERLVALPEFARFASSYFASVGVRPVVAEIVAYTLLAASDWIRPTTTQFPSVR